MTLPTFPDAPIPWNDGITNQPTPVFLAYMRQVAAEIVIFETLTGGVSGVGSLFGTPASLPGYLFGLTLSNNVSDATNDIDIAVGSATNSTGLIRLDLASALTKRLDAAWAVGTNQGGLDTGAIANTTYHVFVIRRPDTEVVDALFSASATAPTLPTSYTQFRRIGSIVRLAASIRAFTQLNSNFLWLVPIVDIASGTATSAAGTLITLSVPTGIKVIAQVNFRIDFNVAGNVILFTSPDQTNTNPAGSGVIFQGFTTSQTAQTIYVRTSTAAQIRQRSDNSSLLYGVSTFGWQDDRGQSGP